MHAREPPTRGRGRRRRAAASSATWGSARSGARVVEQVEASALSPSPRLDVRADLAADGDRLRVVVAVHVGDEEPPDVADARRPSSAERLLEQGAGHVDRPAAVDEREPVVGLDRVDVDGPSPSIGSGSGIRWTPGATARRRARSSARRSRRDGVCGVGHAQQPRPACVCRCAKDTGRTRLDEGDDRRDHARPRPRHAPTTTSGTASSLASTARGDRRHPRDHYVAIDTFLAVASRHDAGMVDAIAPLVRRAPRTGRTSPTTTSPPAAPTRRPSRT